MGIEGDGTVGGTLRLMSFDDQDMRQKGLGGHLIASIAPYWGRTVVV